MSSEHRGYVEITGPERDRFERDVLSCSHCQRQVAVPPGEVALRLDRCGQCDRTLCLTCAAELARTLTCAPWEKRLEQLEARAQTLRALGV